MLTEMTDEQGIISQVTDEYDDLSFSMKCSAAVKERKKIQNFF